MAKEERERAMKDRSRSPLPLSMVARSQLTPDKERLAIVMVGLPARGKSFISMRLTQYLRWQGQKARVFNVGNHRRTTEVGKQTSSYFDSADAENFSRREQLARDVLQSAVNWLDEEGTAVAVFDATNTTRARRKWVCEAFSAAGVGVLFLESVCTDATVLEANILQKLAKSADYIGMDQEVARNDLVERLKCYEDVYEPLGGSGEEDFSYISLYNLSSHIVAHRVFGRCGQLLSYVMALHVMKRPIWLVRLPSSAEANTMWKAGGDNVPHLHPAEAIISEDGRRFSLELAKLASNEFRTWSQWSAFIVGFKRARQACELFPSTTPIISRSALLPQDRGALNGCLVREHFKERDPEFASALEQDFYATRFPKGESYNDMIQRMLPVVIEIEQQVSPVVVVAPLSTLQLLYCYYSGQPASNALDVRIKFHEVVEMKPNGAVFTERRLLGEPPAKA